MENALDAPNGDRHFMGITSGDKPYPHTPMNRLSPADHQAVSSALHPLKTQKEILT
jgi:hypothetical protein